MAILLVNLVESQQIAAVVTAYYTATARQATIKNATVTNTTASNVTFSLHLVEEGGTADATNIIISNKSVTPNETYNCPELVGKNISTDGSLQAVASSATSLTLHISGIEVT